MAERGLIRAQSGISIGAYSRKDGDDIETAVYALGGPLALLFLSSVLQAAASIDECSFRADCTQLYGYSVALGIVSASLLLIFFVAFAIPFCRERLHEKVLLGLTAGLLLWWCVGVALTTFQVTVRVTTKYIASFVALIFAALIAHSEFEQFRQLVSGVKALERHSQATFYLFLSSLVETAAAVFSCVDVVCTGVEIYGIILGGISLVLCAILLRADSDDLGVVGDILVSFQVVWWVVGLGIMTIGSGAPFPQAGNGFFSCWACFLLSCFVVQAKVFPQSENFMSMGRTTAVASPA
jgi:hypothetical protein